MKTIRFGIIGCGLMGREFASAAARWKHLIGMTARPEIVAVSDVNPQAMEWFETPFATTDYRELLARADVDAVYVAVPHDLHQTIYCDAIRAGKHLFAEKPFGIDLAAAYTIMECIQENPNVLVRCSSEFPFFPGAQRIAKMVADNAFGRILEVRAGFCHSSDLDPTKPINWKRRVATCGEYGCMGDLGLHVLHLPLRFGFEPTDVRALLSKVVETRPDGKGGTAPCETWDNAILACRAKAGFPMVLETKRISPGDTNTWYLRIYGTENSVEFSTRHPKTLRTLPYQPGKPQAWCEEDLGYASAYPAITGGIFEFGFPDAILQMWASFVDELAGNEPKFRCATPEEAFASHRLFTAALESQREASVVFLA
ncbi:MAG: Gfo/Idh/MocA family oxidoreductase [Armatimonadetes bacterium]|nr:Gfo/Idh/MocA family oxidoreductase [Armatimonadota bacterium]